MTPKTAAKIAASLRDQALDVQLGILAPAEWVKRYDEAVAAGVTFPARVAAYRDDLAAKS